MTNELIAELEALADEWENRYEEYAEYGPADMYAEELKDAIQDHD